ncbi:MAG TPA: energy transducer TonB [Pyrinomonadaceae bacterium]|jgi:protein TonB
MPSVEGGVLNGRALSKPRPEYPTAALRAREQGTVIVRILVDETGLVLSACAEKGPPLLRRPSESAAYNARFTPTKLSGKPVKVTGIITYNYVLQ